eukprot:TRINITY_DN735_c0_g1_i9.p6 TRINITY_DN735_c0_g1~~TRINITY_DN735_c0_g1_i9.p6  ORF type:complete len:108 (+),score=25.08 TRINITY_DN735_c0_g1_i9:146-469(+)
MRVRDQPAAETSETFGHASRQLISRCFQSVSVFPWCFFFFSSRRRHTRSVSAFLLNRSSDLGGPGTAVRIARTELSMHESTRAPVPNSTHLTNTSSTQFGRRLRWRS